LALPKISEITKNIIQIIRKIINVSFIVFVL
jgi:hypothetical protein